MALLATQCNTRAARRALRFLLAGLFLCLLPEPMLGQQDTAGNLTGPSVQRRPRPGRFIVEVVRLSDGGPVAGIQVELLQTGRLLFTDASGRVQFFLPAGEYDARAYGLGGPGPSLRSQDVHASVRPGQVVVGQAYDCDDCM